MVSPAHIAKYQKDKLRLETLLRNSKSEAERKAYEREYSQILNLLGDSVRRDDTIEGDKFQSSQDSPSTSINSKTPTQIYQPTAAEQLAGQSFITDKQVTTPPTIKGDGTLAGDIIDIVMDTSGDKTKRIDDILLPEAKRQQEERERQAREDGQSIAEEMAENFRAAMGNFTMGFGEGFENIFSGFGSGMGSGMESMFSGLGAGLGAGMGDVLSGTGQGLGEGLAGTGQGLGTGLGSAVSGTGQGLSDSLPTIAMYAAIGLVGYAIVNKL